MKYTFKDAYDNFENVQVGECFTFVNSSEFPPTTVFMKLPMVIHEECTYNSINLVNNKLYYICSRQQIVIHDVELTIKKR